MAAKNTDVKAFIDNLKKPFSEMKMRKTALLAKFLSIIEAVTSIQASEAKALSQGAAKAKAKAKGSAKGASKKKRTEKAKPAIEKKVNTISDKEMERQKKVKAAVSAREVKREKAAIKNKDKIPAVEEKKADQLLAKEIVKEQVVEEKKGKDKEQRELSKEEQAIELRKKQLDIQESHLDLAEKESDLGERRDKINSDRWDNSLPGILSERAKDIGSDFADTTEEISKAVLGPLHSIAGKVSNLAISIFKRFKFDFKDKIKQKILDKKRWFLEKIDRFKQWKLMKSVDKHTGGMTKLQKAQMWMQTFLGGFASVVQALLGGMMSTLGSIAKWLVLGELASVVAGALMKLWDDKIYPMLPDWMKSNPNDATGGQFDAGHPLETINRAKAALIAMTTDDPEARKKAYKELKYTDAKIDELEELEKTKKYEKMRASINARVKDPEKRKALGLPELKQNALEKSVDVYSGVAVKAGSALAKGGSENVAAAERAAGVIADKLEKSVSFWVNKISGKGNTVVAPTSTNVSQVGADGHIRGYAQEYMEFASNPNIGFAHK